MAKQKSKQELSEDAGALSVDWIVLTAAFLGLAIVTAASIQAGSEGLAANVGTYIAGNATF